MTDDLGRVPAEPGSCPSDRAAKRPAPAGFDPSRGDLARWTSSDLIASLLAGPYDAEQDDGEVTLWFGTKLDAVSVTFDAKGALFVLSPARKGFGVLRASWADILRVATPLASVTETQRAETQGGSVHEGTPR